MAAETVGATSARCPNCGALIVLVGRVHRCLSDGGVKEAVLAPVPLPEKGVRRVKGVGGVVGGSEKPWVSAGVSKATWYRRRKAGKG